MFVGHFAAGLAGKRFAPKVSLATLILAAILSDVLWILFFPIGIEHVEVQPGLMPANSLNLVYIPYSHSLLLNVVWGALLSGIYFYLRKDTRGAQILFAAVVSHWFLDFASHRPDMPLMPGLDLRLGIVLLTAIWLTSLRGDPPPSLSALAIVDTVFLAIVLAWASWMNRNRIPVDATE